MGKTVKVKSELIDVSNLLDVISVLKDVATNRFFQNFSKKEDVSKFLEAFHRFFKAVASDESTSPLVDNNAAGVDILVFTSEASFMSQLNSRICNTAYEIYQQHKNARIICVGWRGSEKCEVMGMKVEKLYRDLNDKEPYSLSFGVRDYLVDRVMKGVTGETIAVYAWAKSFSLVKPAFVQLLPVKAVLENINKEGKAAGEAGTPSEGVRALPFLRESPADSMMKTLTDTWVACKIYEMYSEVKLAEAAAQAQQLDAAIDGLKKEKKTLTLNLRKSQRGDLNQALSEVSTSSRMCAKK